MNVNGKAITWKQARVLISAVGVVIATSGSFYGGIALATSHADEKVRELKQDLSRDIEKLQKTVEATNQQIAMMGNSVVRLETLFEERYGRGHRTHSHGPEDTPN